jgi:tRNA G10  N-methylase Trm11
MHARNSEVSGVECEERRESGEIWSVKKRESVMRRENDRKPYIQSLCTAHLYSTKH